MSVENLDGEIWKVIDHPSIGCYDNYAISNYGRVLSKAGNKEKLLKPGTDKDSYLKVILCNGKRKKSFLVHRLVAILFLENPLNLPCVNHKIEGKEGKSMNFVFFKSDGEVDLERTTIEFCDYKYNSNYGTCIARVQQKRKETLKTSLAHKKQIVELHAKLSRQVFQYNQNFELLNVFPSTHEVERQTGYRQSNISVCCRANINLSCTTKYKTAYGFIWSYEPIETSSNQLTLFPLTETNVS